MMERRILLVEDDPNLGRLLHEYLGVKGFRVTLAVDGLAGLDAFKKEEFDFIILDVMMPKKDGFTLAREIRAMDEQIPILFLTAKTMKEDTLEGFKSGGDDYMSKPFSMEELLLRIEAIYRRVYGKDESRSGPFQLGLFTFYPDMQVLEGNGERNKLTTKESQLLLLLSQRKNKTLDRGQALKRIWGDDTYHNGRSMDVYITKLRKHLRADTSLEILNVHGQGFKLLEQASA